tara:strand:- start:78 stop:587 length:510 start_codon:yes stop_codon:yes gene_type:complete
MGIKVNMAVKRPEKAKRGGRVAKVTERLFEQYKEKQIDRIKQSIENAVGRYTEGHRLDKNYGSMNWRIEVEGNEADQENNPDLCAVFIKIGTKKWVNVETEDGLANESYVYSPDLIENLNGMREYMEGLEEDSEDGKSFMVEVIRVCAMKAKFPYNEESGLMDLGKPEE